MKNFISKNLNNSTQKQISIFCGAGISLNSGLPTAYGFLETIFKGVSADKNLNINDIIKKLPFEAIVELMVNYTENYDCLSLFANVSIKPNTNHNFIIKMAIDGIIDKIYTTNFDLLFEKAATNIGHQIQTLYKDSEFNDKNLNDDNIRLIKIHGSAHDIESMKITLKSIANKTQIDARTNVVKSAFDSEKPQIVVIIGYSCSDFFDIVPAIQGIIDSKTEIIFIQHSDKIFEESKINMVDKIGDVENPFKKFEGYFIETNTNEFIKEWHKELYKKDCIESKSSFNWEKNLTVLIKELNELKYKFLATLCYRVGKYRKAIELYEKAKKQFIYKQSELPFIYSQLSLLNHIENNEELAENYLSEANKIALTLENKFVLANNLEIRAERELKKENYEKALECYTSETKIRTEMKDSLHLAKAYQGISVAYRYMENIPLSKEYTQKALILAEANSDLWLLSDLYNNKGDLLSKEGKFEEAKLYINKAIEIKKKIYDRRNLFNAYLSLGTLCKNNNEFDEAEKKYEKANEIAVNDDFHECIPMINYQFAILYVTPQKQDLTKLVMHLDIAFEEYEKQDDKLGIARCKSLYGQLCEYIRNSMFNNAKNKLEFIFPTEWSRIKNDINNIKINFNSKYENCDDKTLDDEIKHFQSKLSTQLSDLDQGIMFHQLGKLYEIKMKNYLYQAVDILLEINPIEADMIIKKYV